jgi:hypothetical protein
MDDVRRLMFAAKGNKRARVHFTPKKMHRKERWKNRLSFPGGQSPQQEWVSAKVNAFSRRDTSEESH